MSRQKQKTHQFAVMWDCDGLECVRQVPDPALATWAVLQDKKPKPPPNILHWRLRAVYNLQRHYEIYILTTDTSITEDDIQSWFENDPQGAADLVRKRGYKFYSDRDTGKKVIT